MSHEYIAGIGGNCEVCGLPEGRHAAIESKADVADEAEDDYLRPAPAAGTAPEQSASAAQQAQPAKKPRFALLKRGTHGLLTWGSPTDGKLGATRTVR